MSTVTATLDLARSQLGTVESPPNSNNVKYGVAYGLNRNPWCAMYVTWLLDQTGNRSGYRFAAVASSLAWARKTRRATSEFRPGYVACKINSGGTSGPGHTGIVEAVHSDGSVTCIEGNTSPGAAGSQRDGGGVWRRRRPKSYWNKQCIRIDYSGAPQTPPTAPPAGGPATGERCPEVHPTIKQGAKGRPVNHLQHYLIWSGAKITGDGDFGPATTQAVRNHQTWLRDHRREPVTVDGVVGPKTWQAMHNWSDNLRI